MIRRIPPTAVMTIALRSLLREIPMWQVAASTGIGLVSGAVLIWLAGKALRSSLLRYGQRLRWSEMFGSKPVGRSVGLDRQ